MTGSVIIAGFGSLSSLGGSRSEVSRSYAAGDAASRTIAYATSGGSIPVFPISSSAERLLIERCRANPFLKERDRVVQLAAYAALDAIAAARDNGITVEGLRVGVVCGSARGATASLEHEMSRSCAGEGVAVSASPSTTAGVIASSVAQACSLDGITVDTSMTCTSGLHALLVARALIVADEIDLAIVVGCEAALTPFTVDQVKALRISPRYDHTDPYPCRPFSNEEPSRSRMVLGEGAAALVILGERSVNLAKKSCYHRVDGIGFAAESPPSLTGIGSEGTHFQEAMARAISNAGLSINDISAVICHAPGTPKGDRAELHALQAVFGETIPPLYSTKWLTGHTYGASGLLSIELACLIGEGLNPASPSFPSYAPQLVGSRQERGSQDGREDRFLINAAGFGGNAISVVVSYRS